MRGRRPRAAGPGAAARPRGAALPGPGRLPVAARAGAAAVVVAVVVVVALAAGAPAWAERQIEQFLDPSPAAASSTDQRDRLTVFNSNGRVEHWNVALDSWRGDQLKGTGAGTFQNEWNRERAWDFQVLDAHSLYIETLGEMGVVGLVLLSAALLALVVGLVSRLRGPDRPAAAAVLAVLCTWMMHAGVDWDWELVAVSIGVRPRRDRARARARERGAPRDAAAAAAGRGARPAGAGDLAGDAVALAGAPRGRGRRVPRGRLPDDDRRRAGLAVGDRRARGAVGADRLLRRPARPAQAGDRRRRGGRPARPRQLGVPLRARARAGRRRRGPTTRRGGRAAAQPRAARGPAAAKALATGAAQWERRARRLPLYIP